MPTPSQNPKVERYWQSYVESLEPGVGGPESYEVWHFGSTVSGAKRLAQLVRSGKKTATSGLVWELEAGTACLTRETWSS